MKLTVILMVFAMLAGCKTTSSGDVDITTPPGGIVWNEKSERIYIIHDLTLTYQPREAPDYIIHDYSRDMLTPAAKTALYNLSTIPPAEVVDGCMEDVSWYQVIVTDNTGIEREYWSHHKCFYDDVVTNYIEHGEIEALIELLDPN